MTVYVLNNGNPTRVYHGPSCRCLREHWPYKGHPVPPAGLRPCGYCGGR